jgi:hypothetical protein
MARGWESKAVESQQQDADAPKVLPRALTPLEREQAARRLTLEMAKASTLQELRAAERPPHREMLRMKLESIEAELGTLGTEPADAGRQRKA